MKTISHDAFARTELLRSRIWVHGETCTECGSVNTTKNGEHYLYIYGTSRDDRPLKSISGKAFCSISCYRAYYGATI